MCLLSYRAQLRDLLGEFVTSLGGDVIEEEDHLRELRSVVFLPVAEILDTLVRLSAILLGSSYVGRRRELLVKLLGSMLRASTFEVDLGAVRCGISALLKQRLASGCRTRLLRRRFEKSGGCHIFDDLFLGRRLLSIGLLIIAVLVAEGGDWLWQSTARLDGHAGRRSMVGSSDRWPERGVGGVNVCLEGEHASARHDGN